MAPRSLVRLVLLALLWGSSFLWIKLALDGLSPVQLVLVRLALGAAVLVAVVRLRRLRLPHDRTTWLHLTVAALVANAIPYLLFAFGEQTVSSSLAGALNATTPLWTLGIGLAARTERQVTPMRVVGLLVGFAGALVILAPWKLAEGTGLLAEEVGHPYGIHGIFEDQGHVMTRIREEVSARMPRPEERHDLRLPPGVPVLDVLHTSLDQEGQPYELTRFVMRADLTGLLYDVPVE